MVQNVILVFFRRRLSQRPAVEELESRNILKREYRRVINLCRSDVSVACDNYRTSAALFHKHNISCILSVIYTNFLT